VEHLDGAPTDDPRHLGRLEAHTEAEPLFRRAIEIGEKVLGKDHPNVAVWYNNLAVLLRQQGKYD